MRTGFAMSEIDYAKKLAGAGLDGVTTAWRESNPSCTPGLARLVWVPVAFGATVGVLNAIADKHRRSVPKVALAGAVGSALGLGAGLLYASRSFTAAAARDAMREVNHVRDAHWLEKHPIAYA